MLSQNHFAPDCLSTVTSIKVENVFFQHTLIEMLCKLDVLIHAMI